MTVSTWARHAHGQDAYHLTVDPTQGPRRVGPTALSAMRTPGAYLDEKARDDMQWGSEDETAGIHEDVVIPWPGQAASPPAGRGQPTSPGDLGLLPIPGRGVRHRLLPRARQRPRRLPASARAAVHAGSRSRRSTARPRPRTGRRGSHPEPPPGTPRSHRAAAPGARHRVPGARRVRAAPLSVLGQRSDRRPDAGRSNRPLRGGGSRRQDT